MVFAPGPSWQHAQRLRRRALLPRRRCGASLAAAGVHVCALAAGGQQAQTKNACIRGPKRPEFPERERTRAARAQGTDAVGTRMQWLGTRFVRCVRAFAANAAWASSVCAPACGGVRRSEACVLVCVCTCLPRAKLLRRHSWPQNGARTWYQVRVRCRFRWCMIVAGLQILKSQYRDFTEEIE